MIKGIIFDYGGTIDSRGEHWSEVIYRGWKAAGLDVDKDTFRKCYVEAERALARERIIMPDHDFRTLLQHKATIELTDYLKRGALLTPQMIPDYATRIADYCDGYARMCIEEARPVLRELSERYPMMLVSNFYGNVDSVLRAYDLRRYFQGIIESAVVGVRKPAPRIFMLGVVALGLKPEEVLVVGDSLKKDILPAESIGCRTAWIKGKGWTADEDAATHPSQIKDIREVATAVLTY
ncbi:MAG: HAD family hydrolase [Muribaculaceae bacterium]|nr:HAD family hydrolase [Muribaculaceae bacterium]